MLPRHSPLPASLISVVSCRHAQAFERFGPMFVDFRGWGWAPFCYEGVRTWVNLVVGLIVGLQEGSGMEDQ